jgi:hypothetical protein
MLRTSHRIPIRHRYHTIHALLQLIALPCHAYPLDTTGGSWGTGREPEPGQRPRVPAQARMLSLWRRLPQLDTTSWTAMSTISVPSKHLAL